jgi:hypothetical protein
VKLKYDSQGNIVVPTKMVDYQITGVDADGNKIVVTHTVSQPDAGLMYTEPDDNDRKLAPYKARKRKLEQQGKLDLIREFTHKRFRDPVDIYFEEAPELSPETDLEHRPENPFEGATP